MFDQIVHQDHHALSPGSAFDHAFDWFFDRAWAWVAFTVIAAAGQTARNAMQRELTARLGAVGATHVRFLFGAPFALGLLAVVLSAAGAVPPRPAAQFWPWIVAGALTQVVATALMLLAMTKRSFVVAIAYVKTEPIQVAVFGLVFLGDALTLGSAAAIAVATAGVVLMSQQTGGKSQRQLRPVLLGLGAASLFALSAVGYRGAILSLNASNFIVAATFTLALGLILQATLLSLYLAIRDRAVLMAIMRAWRPSLFAGAMGTLASENWFLAFALATAASVRTLGLIEIVFAQAVSRLVFKQRTSLREAVGICLITGAAIALILAA